MCPKKTQIYLSSHCLPRELDKTADTAAKCAVKSIEVDVNTAPFAEYFGGTAFDVGLAEDLRKSFNARGVGIGAVLCRINPAVTDKDLRRRDTERFMTMIRYAKALGADMICTGAGYAETAEETRSEEAFGLLCEELGPIVSRAECQGVTAALELSEDTVLYSAERAARLISELGSERIALFVNAENVHLLEGLTENEKNTILRDVCAVRIDGFPSDALTAALKEKFDFKSDNDAKPKIIFDKIAAEGFSAAAEYTKEKFLNKRCFE